MDNRIVHHADFRTLVAMIGHPLFHVLSVVMAHELNLPKERVESLALELFLIVSPGKRITSHP